MKLLQTRLSSKWTDSNLLFIKLGVKIQTVVGWAFPLLETHQKHMWNKWMFMKCKTLIRVIKPTFVYRIWLLFHNLLHIIALKTAEQKATPGHFQPLTIYESIPQLSSCLERRGLDPMTCKVPSSPWHQWIYKSICFAKTGNNMGRIHQGHLRNICLSVASLWNVAHVYSTRELNMVQHLCLKVFTSYRWKKAFHTASVLGRTPCLIFPL